MFAMLLKSFDPSRPPKRSSSADRVNLSALPGIDVLGSIALNKNDADGREDPGHLAARISLAVSSFDLAIQLATRVGRPTSRRFSPLLRSKLGKLRVVEHAEIVELLLHRRRDMRQFLQIVRNTARRERWKPDVGASAGISSATGVSAAPRSMPESPCAREMPSMAALAMRSQ